MFEAVVCVSCVMQVTRKSRLTLLQTLSQVLIGLIWLCRTRGRGGKAVEEPESPEVETKARGRSASRGKGEWIGRHE